MTTLKYDRKTRTDGKFQISVVGKEASHPPLHLVKGVYGRKGTHSFPKPSKSLSLLGVATIVLSSTLSPANALVIQKNTPSMNSSQALDLLNTARRLRSQRKISNGGDKHTQELKRRIKMKSSVPYNTSWKSLFDDEEKIAAKSILEQQDAFMTSRVQAQLPSVKSLQGSLGSEIPDMELRLQMEAAKLRASSCNGKVVEGSAVAAALAFMDVHHEKLGTGTSAIEKVAMSSLPIQLPGLATAVLSNVSLITTTSQQLKSSSKKSAVEMSPNASGEKRNHRNIDRAKTHEEEPSNPALGEKSEEFSNLKGRRTKDDTLNKSHQRRKSLKVRSKDISTIMATRRALEINTKKRTSASQPSTKSEKEQQSPRSTRVSHEQEIQLAHIIQRGVELHSLKSKFEEKKGRDINRQEWTELAQLDSPRELRRMVSDYRKAKNKLVMANMGLVHAIVRSRLGISGGRGSGGLKTSPSAAASGTSYEELIQEGSLGLLRASELFDPSRGLRFSTYATIWIKGVLSNSNVSETICLPQREKTKYNKIQKAITDILAARGGDEDEIHQPSHEDIARHCGLGLDEVELVMVKMKRARNVLSLDYQYDSFSRSGVQNDKFSALSNDKNLMDDVDLVERLHVRADVIAALTRNLDPREARLMRLRYGLNDGRTRSIKDCAEAMGISRSRAQELAVGCLKKLREADDAESLQEYLLSVA